VTQTACSRLPGTCVFLDGLNGRNVRRDTTSAVRFEAYAFPAPLKLFAKLPMPKECYLAGTPPFTLVIEYSTGREQIVTFDRSRTGVSSFWNDMHGVYQLISCEDAETVERSTALHHSVVSTANHTPNFPMLMISWRSDQVRYGSQIHHKRVE
jgi:hypothetical protein